MAWHVRLPRMISGSWMWDYICPSKRAMHYVIWGEKGIGPSFKTKEEAEAMAVLAASVSPNLIGRLEVVYHKEVSL